MDNPLKDAYSGIALGRGDFIEEVKKKISIKGRDREIGGIFDIDYVTVSSTVRRFKSEMEKGEEIKQVMGEVLKGLYHQMHNEKT